MVNIRDLVCSTINYCHILEIKCTASQIDNFPLTVGWPRPGGDRGPGGGGHYCRGLGSMCHKVGRVLLNLGY